LAHDDGDVTQLAVDCAECDTALKIKMPATTARTTSTPIKTMLPTWPRSSGVHLAAAFRIRMYAIVRWSDIADLVVDRA
jgi:hypothetical protein